MNKKYLNNWHQVWSNRKLTDTNGETILEKLISIDGFDSPLGLMSESDWRNYLRMFAKRSNILEGDSIFEVGCGGGAFLYPFYESGYVVSGVDYSAELIKVAKSVMPTRESYLEHKEASALKIEPTEEIVIANHVIHYFPSLSYAADVMNIMLGKATKAVSVSGIPDQSLKLESETMRRGLLAAEEYDFKYKGLDILYFEKAWFEKIALDNGFIIQFFNHSMPGFAQNAFRFDCLLTRIKK